MFFQTLVRSKSIRKKVPHPNLLAKPEVDHIEEAADSISLSETNRPSPSKLQGMVCNFAMTNCLCYIYLHLF